ncbi:MAG: sensor domain-containing diguanylate cyclase [Cohaesibacter sp.]|nr:sensor domain-containing diguanylate cyclase [Cohaesibacter sp.]
MTKNWTIRSLIFAFLGAYTTIIGTGLYFAPDFLAKKLVMSETERRASLWQIRVLGLLAEDQHSPSHQFDFQHLDEHSKEAMQHFVLASDAFRLRLFKGDGDFFWSSHSDVKPISDQTFFKQQLKHGIIVQQMSYPRIAQIEGFDTEHMGEVYSDQDIRTVLKTYVPVMAGTQVTGIVETCRDVTQQIGIYKTRLTIAGLLIASALSLTIITALVLSYQYRRRTSILAKAQREKEQAIMRKDLRRNREVRLLSQLSEWMQASKSMEELFEIASSILQKLLPDAAGSIYIYSNSRDVLEGMASWNGAQHQAEMLPDECWGLRRGRVYIHGLDEIDFACSHDHDSHDAVYVCLPIVAHGDTIGLMHLDLGALGQDEHTTDKAVKLAQTCAEQLSLAIANVRLRDELRSQSIRDPLTGLYNRRHFFETCRNRIATARRKEQNFAIASFDVDHFKLFNDNHGHDAGDMVLRAVGECLLNNFDGNDLSFRIGGEEFTILLYDCDQDQAFERIEALRQTIEDIVLHYDGNALPNITMSAGIAMFPTDGQMPQDLMKAADQALYRAKAAGRNQVLLVNNPQELTLDLDWQKSEASETDKDSNPGTIQDLQDALIKATA